MFKYVWGNGGLDQQHSQVALELSGNYSLIFNAVTSYSWVCVACKFLLHLEESHSLFFHQLSM